LPGKSLLKLLTILSLGGQQSGTTRVIHYPMMLGKAEKVLKEKQLNVVMVNSPLLVIIRGQSRVIG